MARNRSRAEQEIEINPIKTCQVTFCVLGTSPLIFNRLTEKARQALLLGGAEGKRDRKARGIAKHNPWQEFRDAMYRFATDDMPTRLYMPAGVFKGALMTAAIDIPDTAKAQIGRLTYIVERDVPIYGIPQVYTTIVRQAGANRTPDVRTRAILREWAAYVTISFVTPLLTETTVANLFAAAGIICGIGDYRQEKGKGDHGKFTLVSADDATFCRILKEGGRDAQDLAIGNPQAYDAETDELLRWFDSTVESRRLRVVA